MNTSDEISGVVLEFACHEYIDQHNYCNSCARTIIDFTCLKNQDLADAINKSDGKVCGIFNNSQLSQQFVKYASVGVMTASLTLAASAQEERGLLINDSTLKACVKRLADEEGLSISYATVGIMIAPMPTLKMSYKQLMDTIELQLSYPKDLRTKYIAYITVDVENNGNIKSARIDTWQGKSTINNEADAEALRVVQALKDVFEPAMLGDLPIGSTYSFQIEFNPEKRKQKNR